MTNWNDRLAGAAINGNIETFEEAIAEGIDIHFEGDAAFRIAVKNRHHALIEFLVGHDADIHGKNDIALREAAQEGWTDTVRLLLDLKADIHAVENDALYRAADYGRTETVRLLLDRGARIHAGEDAALLIAAKQGRIPVVQLLLNREANIHAASNGALRLAVAHGHTEIVALLVNKAGPDAGEPYAAQRALLHKEVEFFLAKPAALYDPDDLFSLHDLGLIDRKGEATPRLCAITAAGMLGELFSPSRWEQREPQAFKFLQRLRDALPSHYKSMADAVDTTALRRAALSALPAGFVAKTQIPPNLSTTARR